MTRRRFRRDPTHALFAYQSQSIPDNLVALFGGIRAWNYSAETAPSAVSCTPRIRSENRHLTKPNTVVIRRAGYGALGRLDRVRGVRFLRLTCRAADGRAQPEMTHGRRSARMRRRARIADLRGHSGEEVGRADSGHSRRYRHPQQGVKRRATGTGQAMSRSIV